MNKTTRTTITTQITINVWIHVVSKSRRAQVLVAVEVVVVDVAVVRNLKWNLTSFARRRRLRSYSSYIYLYV